LPPSGIENAKQAAHEDGRLVFLLRARAGARQLPENKELSGAIIEFNKITKK
jgi:hypothetical protein